MEESRFKIGICHARKVGARVVTGKSVSPQVIFKSVKGYPTREVVQRIIIPELAEMSRRGRKDIVFPLGLYLYAYHGKVASPKRRVYVQEIPEKSVDLLGTRRKAVYFVDEQYHLFEVARDNSIRPVAQFQSELSAKRPISGRPSR